MTSIIPTIPFAMDACTTREVPKSAATASTIAPRRSDQAARLKPSHQTMTASPPASPPTTATKLESATTSGTANQSVHCSTTAITPGHSRSGLR